MENETLGIIYAIKQGQYSSEMNIRKFISEWSNSDWDYQGRDSIDTLLRRTISDYLQCCGNKYEIARYFEDSSLWIKNEYDRMISFLRDIKIIDNKIYINGMRDNPYPNFEVFWK